MTTHSDMLNKKILIFGGSGSLGNALIKKYSQNQIVNFSRDECKHWQMELEYKNVKNIIGNIQDPAAVRTAILREQPHIIIIAAALKHIDRCEFASHECINTNIMGIKNVLDCVEEYRSGLTCLETVVFISTDKACNPINTYGMCKAISEKMMIEKAFYVKTVKFVTVRYGNVLNSRGSIIPILHSKGETAPYFTLTHTDMTRFIMTLEESCELIEYAILQGASGEIIIPKLRAMRIVDMFEIFSELYNKPIKIVGLRPGEKMDEALINETQSVNTKDNGVYYHIQPNYKQALPENGIVPAPFIYHSGQSNITKSELKQYLIKCNLIEPRINIEITGGMTNDPYPHYMQDMVLDVDVANVIREELVNAPATCFDRYQNPFEEKWTYADKNALPPVTSKLFSYLTSKEWVNKLSAFVGIPLINDADKMYWGVHKFMNGDKLDIHVDAGVQPTSGLKKECTLGFYMSHNWKPEYGGEFEVWRGHSAGGDLRQEGDYLQECVSKIEPVFNRMVMFTCTDNSWHGSSNPVQCPPDAVRIFLTISYLSERTEFENHKMKAFFVKRPGDPVDEYKDCLRLVRADPEGCKNVYRTSMM